MTTWQLTRHAAKVGMAQLPAHASIPSWALGDEHEAPFWSVTRTADELSVICAYDAFPGSLGAAGPFVAFSVVGPLDHSLVGVMHQLLAPLAAAEISILAAGTFDTDWVLVPTKRADEATDAWRGDGHQVELEEQP